MNGTSPVECWEISFDPESGNFATPIIITGLLALSTISANIFVLFTILSTEKLRKQSFHVWIVSLACSDILFITITCITHTLGQFQYEFNYNITLFFMFYIGFTSYYTFLGLNIDRAYAVRYPLRVIFKSKHSNVISILSCWVLALLPSLPYLWDSSLAVCGEHCPSCWIPVDNKPLIWWNGIVGSLVPIMGIFCTWGVICFELNKKFSTLDARRLSSREKQNRGVIVRMGILTLVFIVCSLPLAITFMSSAISRPRDTSMMITSHLLSSLNCLINPCHHHS
eukprot:GFUD01034487.1.p1 GENE.GFUD01034487.1~~GFUD01034487.1.p1  ORF type:complete len:282 (+),score=36.19 GFUD01034487.1:63-908(+)